MPNYEPLLTWVEEKKTILKDAIFTNKTRYDLLQLLWVYQDVRIVQFKDILPTDFITHRI